MSDQVNMCHGCDLDSPNNDHYHQYINLIGNAASNWYVDGKNFRNPSDAMVYLEQVLDCDADEAHKFLQTLPRRYN